MWVWLTPGDRDLQFAIWFYGMWIGLIILAAIVEIYLAIKKPPN